jgi:methylthioribose-1-phosphate isomerase
VKVEGRHYRTIWLNADGRAVDVIDQRRLPHKFRIETIRSVGAMATAIREMWVRGAPLIGVAAAYGLALQTTVDASDAALKRAAAELRETRPTAVNLRWALDEMLAALLPAPAGERLGVAYRRAAEIADDDVAIDRNIGQNGLAIIEELARKKPPGQPLNILTHCNAGWLATVDYGTATAPIYLGAQRGLNLHVYVDETRPRNQGAQLTAWELGQEKVAHTLIVDNAGGHLMRQGLIDMVIVGTDRTAANGDVCNKIGTYLKALAAHDNGVPFYVALPSSSIDWSLPDGAAIPIEQRSADEVSYVWGRTDDGRVSKVRISPDGTDAANYAFDVTPARLVTGLITERGVCAASSAGLRGLFREHAASTAAS